MAERLADAKPTFIQIKKQNLNLLTTCQRKRARCHQIAKTKSIDLLTVIHSLLVLTERLLTHLLPFLGTGRTSEGVGSTVREHPLSDLLPWKLAPVASLTQVGLARR